MKICNKINVFYLIKYKSIFIFHCLIIFFLITIHALYKINSYIYIHITIYIFKILTYNILFHYNTFSVQYENNNKERHEIKI